jgi:ATP-dependent exoDNAse (exonuclease V) beta subunit
MDVRDIGNLLAVFADPNDDFALLSVLRSPLVGLSMDSIVLLAQQKPVIVALESFEPPSTGDQEALSGFLDWFADMLSYADRLSAWEVLAEVFQRSSYWESLARRRNGRQRVANVRKLFALASSLADMGPREFAEYLRTIREIRSKEGDAAIRDESEQAVTIITVHKSKGLEWPVVIVADNDRDPNKGVKANIYDLETDPRVKMAVAKLGTKSSGYFDLLAEGHKLRDAEEEWRVMYVALTRARDRLCVCVHPTGAGNTFAAELAKRVGYKTGVVPPGIRVRGRDV